MSTITYDHAIQTTLEEAEEHGFLDAAVLDELAETFELNPVTSFDELILALEARGVELRAHADETVDDSRDRFDAPASTDSLPSSS